MDDQIILPKHACQFCGSVRKLVETVIDDEFEHTGEERCVECRKDWTGIREAR